MRGKPGKRGADDNDEEEEHCERRPPEVIRGAWQGEQLLPDRHSLLFQMRAYAVADPEIRAYVRAKFGHLRQTLAELAGVSPEDTWNFFGEGMLLNVVTMLEFDWKHPDAP